MPGIFLQDVRYFYTGQVRLKCRLWGTQSYALGRTAENCPLYQTKIRASHAALIPACYASIIVANYAGLIAAHTAPRPALDEHSNYCDYINEAK